VWRSRMPDGVRCAHFPSVITTIIDHNVPAQLLKPLNLGELYSIPPSRTVAIGCGYSRKYAPTERQRRASIDLPISAEFRQ
jgi:hypothetical protein